MRPDITLVLARILGPVSVIAGIMLITQGARLRAMLADFLGNDGMMVLAGFVMLVLGLLLVTLHQRWNGFTAALVTLYGWITLLRGAALLLAPGLVRDAAFIVIQQPNILPIAGCVIALLGVWLAYTGYISGVLRVDTAPQR